ncbi:MAG: GNAT family N-acetyltransferase [Anaerolineales bacterium]|nr:GNAT family N-acetyltransferase [Anaerolineales bacterium]
MNIRAIPYHEAGNSLRRAFGTLQERVAPTGMEPDLELHDPALDARSFYVSAGEQVISYAAVVRKAISHGGQTFQLAGLSCVATDPAWQRQGLGSRVVSAATAYIETSGVDLGLFTCDPPLAAFYWQAGAWPVRADLVLVGSQHPAALSSRLLDKVVLLRLFSARAQAAAAAFSQTTINLDLPLGQFL